MLCVFIDMPILNLFHCVLYTRVKNAPVQSNIHSRIRWIYRLYHYSEHFRFLIISRSSYTKYKALS